jgi:release factor glutamine methyltransferase
VDEVRTDDGTDRAWVERALAVSGCVAPAEEAGELLSAASDGVGPLDELVRRRSGGEPLAWITGWTTFLGVRVAVDRGVFVPRPHSELVARLAVALLPKRGLAVDLCTGCGAVAVALRRVRPSATIVATDVDPGAVANARRNGVDARLGDLDEPLKELGSTVDVVTAVTPYVPTSDLRFLPRDVQANEPPLALDGGPRGTDVSRRALEAAARLLRRGGAAVLEIGGDQAAELKEAMATAGFGSIAVHQDDEGQDRAIVGSFELHA